MFPDNLKKLLIFLLKEVKMILFRQATIMMWKSLVMGRSGHGGGGCVKAWSSTSDSTL